MSYGKLSRAKMYVYALCSRRKHEVVITATLYKMFQVKRTFSALCFCDKEGLMILYVEL